MYRRPKFLEILLEIRREMALEADYDVELFAENTRSGVRPALAHDITFTDSSAEPDARPTEVRKVVKTRD